MCGDCGPIPEHQQPLINDVAVIRRHGPFKLGASSTGQYEHLASFENTSNWNYQRDRNVAEYPPHVHIALLQLALNAGMDPVKCLKTVNIDMSTPTLDALSETLVQKIRWAKSAAGQRALMTARLRGWVKDRDRHTCQNPACGVSVAVEPHLLLEVDHIVPVSKGALSEPENLQTLCWRCNRTKGAKKPA